MAPPGIWLISIAPPALRTRRSRAGRAVRAYDGWLTSSPQAVQRIGSTKVRIKSRTQASTPVGLAYPSARSSCEQRLPYGVTCKQCLRRGSPCRRPSFERNRARRLSSHRSPGSRGCRCLVRRDTGRRECPCCVMRPARRAFILYGAGSAGGLPGAAAGRAQQSRHDLPYAHCR